MPGLWKAFIAAGLLLRRGGCGSPGRDGVHPWEVLPGFQLMLCWWWSFWPCLRRESSTCRELLTPLAGKSATNLPALGLLKLINSAGE